MALETPLVVQTLSLHGGMNDKDKPWLLAEHVGQLVQNLDISRVGGRKRRTGVSDIGGRGDGPGGLFVQFDTTQNQEALFAVYGGQVYIAPGAGVLQERASAVSLTSMLHMGVSGRYAGRRSSYVLSAHVDDSDVSLASLLMVLTDDNQYSQQASVAPRCAAWFQNRLWIAHNARAQNEETLWWSSLGDGLLYSSFNTLLIEPGVGGRITALLPIRGLTPQLIIFKERAIGVLEPKWGSNGFFPQAADALDTANSRFRLLTENAGCVATLSVQYVPGAPAGDIYFLARDGVRAISRAADDTIAGVSIPVSSPIQTTVDRINLTYAHKAVSAVFDNKYHVAVPLDGATENTHVLSFDLLTGAWFLQSWRPKAFAVARMTEQQTRLWQQYRDQTGDCSVTGLQTAYHIFKSFSGLLDPSGVPVIYQEDSRQFNFDTFEHKKRWAWGSLSVLNEATVTCVMGLQYNLDNSGWVTLTTAVFGPSIQDPILGVTPLPWGPGTASFRTVKFSLEDVDPGYMIALRYIGQSDLSVPTVAKTTLAARPIRTEFDNAAD